MGYKIVAEPNELAPHSAFKYTVIVKELNVGYCPLRDDAQAMALVKRFGIDCLIDDDKTWLAGIYTPCEFSAASKDLNRAICECVASMSGAGGGRAMKECGK
jgi:hypothetical protein